MGLISRVSSRTYRRIMDAESLLSHLKQTSSQISTHELSKQNGFSHQSIVGAMNSLISKGGSEFLKSEAKTIVSYDLSKEAEDVKSNGSYEFRLLSQIPDSGISQPDLMKKGGKNAKIGFAKAMQKKWISLDKPTKTVTKTVDAKSIDDELPKQLSDLSIVDDKTRADLKKRKLFTTREITAYNISKGPEFSAKVDSVLQKQETELTMDMITNKTWKNVSFKDYNFNAKGVPPECGHLHPLMKVRTVYRQILLEMGFNEMPTNNYVESSFWNFDTLFQPQMHPARDAHDTFFISEPSNCDMSKVPSDLVEKVKETHQTGGDTGSIGYRYKWKLEEATKNLLRTHTTAVTSRMLYQLANQPGGFKPMKYFSIDRVFRNETLDATHLAEFHQVEGVIVDYNLTLANLMGILEAFFLKLGITNLKFKPAYNPYTEPSMEIFSYHAGLKKWVEIGNSGMFRPEMLEPLGLPKDVSAIAWGLSLERPTMIRYGINNIRDLCGHKIDLKMVYSNPVCRMDFD